MQLQDESSIAAHLGERAPKLAEDESALLEQQGNAEDIDNQESAENGATPNASAAVQPDTPVSASSQDSGAAASALEAFLDGSAQPSNRQLQHTQSYSK